MRSVGPVLAGLLLLSGCSFPGTTTTTTTQPPLTTMTPVTTRRVETLGKELFEERVIGTEGGCVTCHPRDQGDTLVGPSLFGLSSRIPGLSDAEYVRQSIVDPDAYIAAGYDSDKMPENWAEILTDEQIDSLVDYLLTGA